jgi:hypothetical protein
MLLTTKHERLNGDLTRCAATGSEAATKATYSPLPATLAVLDRIVGAAWL